ncbi:MAG: hypothetical protein GXY55_16815 [Phycisphaerae bacterium]|nr:hypothetical protein [Phycisphaerae bacterium]
MDMLDKDIRELQKRLRDGSIRRAYKGIISYMSRLRTLCAEQRGERFVSALYQGYFDMTYFALLSDTLKERNLKLAIVFNYETFGFEIWLAARNRRVQSRYWDLLLNAGYHKHRLMKPGAGIDAIVTATLAEGCSLEDQESLTNQILDGIRAFESDIVSFLSEVDPG